MAIRNIVPDTDEILHKKCRPITEFNDKLKALIKDMEDTLYKAEGVGLAGPQVGMLRRIFILNLSSGTEEKKPNFKVFINPEIIATMGEQEGPEGCLSVKNFEGWLKRPQKVAVKAFDADGNEFVWEGEDLMARAICHENDHLDGLTIRDTCEYEVTEEDE